MIDVNKINNLPIDKQIKKKIDIIEKYELNQIPPTILPDVFVDKYCFISYSHLDYKVVYKDLFDLQRNGINTWYDKGMPLGKSWKDTANKYMIPRNCLGVIFYITENALRSKAVFDELEYSFNIGKPVMCIVVPFQSDYKHNGESTLGKVFSPREMIEILKENNALNYEIDYNALNKYFGDEILYQDINVNIQKRVDQILITLKEKPLLEYDIEEQSRYDYSSGSTYSIKNLKVTQITDINASKITVDDFGSYYPAISTIPAVFSHCQLLEEAEFPKTEEIKLSNYTFYEDKRLKRVALSDKNVVKGLNCFVDDYCFYNCFELENIGFEVANPGNYSFSNCYRLRGSLFVRGTIGESAFENCRSLEGIDISSIVFYGDYHSNTMVAKAAFRNCINLKECNFIDTVETIGDYAFQSCCSLETVRIGEGVDKISETAFLGCYRLMDIDIKKGFFANSRYVVKGNCLYTNDYKELLLVLNGGDNKIVIKKEVKKISPYAFSLLVDEHKIVLEKGNELLSLKRGSLFSKDGTVLYYLNRNRHGVIPETVKKVKPYCMIAYARLDSADFSDGFDADGNLFNESQNEHVCNLKSLSCPFEVAEQLLKNPEVKSIEELHIIDKKEIVSLDDKKISLKGIKKLYFSNYVKAVGIEYLSSDVEEIYFGRKFNSLHNFLYGCPNLKHVGFIGNKNFTFESGLILSKDKKVLFVALPFYDEVNIPNKVTTIKYQAFRNSRITSFVASNSLTTIESLAFVHCDNLKNVMLSNSVKKVGFNLFLSSENVVFNHYSNCCYIGTKDNPYYYLVRELDSECYSKSEQKFIINDQTKILGYISWNDTDYRKKRVVINIPNGIKCICSFSISGRALHAVVKIPRTVEYIGDYPIDFNYTSSFEIVFKGSEKEWNSRFKDVKFAPDLYDNPLKNITFLK